MYNITFVSLTERERERKCIPSSLGAYKLMKETEKRTGMCNKMS